MFSFIWIVFFLTCFNIGIRVCSFGENVITLVFALFYVGYILVDTQLILGGKNKELSLDNYVLGAVLLYVDIISLFLKILKILGEEKDKKN
jgi:FtsH-binding integral membrane protein